MFDALDTIVFGMFLAYGVHVAYAMIVETRSGGRRKLALTIPNSAVLVVLLALVVKAVALRLSAGESGEHLLILLGTLGVTMFLFFKCGVGGGFAKIVPAVLGYLGPDSFVPATFVFCLILFVGGSLASLLGQRSSGDGARR